MRRASPMRLTKRAPSPLSQESPSPGSAAAASPRGSPFVHSRSFPSNLQQLQGREAQQERAPGRAAGSLHEDPEGRVFRRVVSDSVRQSVGSRQQEEADLDPPIVSMDLDGAARNGIMSPRRGGQRRTAKEKNGNKSVRASSSKSPRRLRYDKVSRSEDQESVRGSREELVSPERGGRKQPVDVRKDKHNENIADNGEGPAEVSRSSNVLRKSWTLPVSVKVEPEDLDAQDQFQSGTVQKSSRQFKQKAADLFASLPTSFSFSSGRNSTAPESPPPPPAQTRQFGYRRPLRDQIGNSQKDDWLQLIMDVIMWRDFAKTTLIFGLGAFCILSASFMQDMHFNIVTVLSYVALTYLSAVFVRRNIMQRLPSSGNDSWKLNEAAALELIRGVLPAVNAVLQKLSQLFSGDPGTTLKVAGVLWCLAHAGYWLSVWNIFRLAFFGVFLVPKGYMAYSAQLHDFGNHLVSHIWSVWDSCSHKKAVATLAVILIWNVSTVSARLWVVFFSVVAFRQYQSSRIFPEEVQSVVVKKEY